MAVSTLISASSEAGLMVSSRKVPRGNADAVSTVQPAIEISVTRLSDRTAFSASRVAWRDVGNRRNCRRSNDWVALGDPVQNARNRVVQSWQRNGNTLMRLS